MDERLQRMFELESQNEQLSADIGVLQHRFHAATEQAAKAQAANESLERLVRVLETNQSQFSPEIAQLRSAPFDNLMPKY